MHKIVVKLTLACYQLHHKLMFALHSFRMAIVSLVDDIRELLPFASIEGRETLHENIAVVSF